MFSGLMNRKRWSGNNGYKADKSREVLHKVQLRVGRPGAAFDCGFQVFTDFTRPIRHTSGAGLLRMGADGFIVLSISSRAGCLFLPASPRLSLRNRECGAFAFFRLMIQADCFLSHP
jgi:hypothetical protein